MEFSIKRSNLFQLCNQIRGFVNKRSNPTSEKPYVYMTIANEYLYTFISSEGTSLSMNLRVNVKTPGELAIFGRDLFHIVKHIPDGEISFRTSEEEDLAGIKTWVVISQRDFVFTIRGMEPDKVKKYENIIPDETGWMSESTKIFSDMIRRVEFCISKDQSRLSISGLHFDFTDRLTMVATNGHQLSKTNTLRSVIPFKNTTIYEKDVVRLKRFIAGSNTVSYRTLMVMSGVGSLSITKMVFKTDLGPHILMVEGIEGDFPDYRKVTSLRTTTTSVVDLGQLFGALQRAMTIYWKGHVDIRFQNGNIIVSSEDECSGKFREKIKTTETRGPSAITFQFDAYLLIEALRVLKRDGNKEVIIGYNAENPEAAMFLDSPAQNNTHVIMPLRGRR